MGRNDSTTGSRPGASATLEELRAAYSRAIYRVDAEPEPIFLRVGAASPELDRRLAASGARYFAFLSAANPGSKALSVAENVRRHLRLLDRVRASGHEALAGESFDGVSGGWREPSLLVVGMDREDALALACEFGQLALLLGERGKPVELFFSSAAQERR